LTWSSHFSPVLIITPKSLYSETCWSGLAVIVTGVTDSLPIRPRTISFVACNEGCPSHYVKSQCVSLRLVVCEIIKTVQDRRRWRVSTLLAGWWDILREGRSGAYTQVVSILLPLWLSAASVTETGASLLWPSRADGHLGSSRFVIMLTIFAHYVCGLCSFPELFWVELRPKKRTMHNRVAAII